MSLAGLLARARERFSGHDRTMLAALAALMIAGFVLSLAASPTAIERMNVDDGPFGLAWRHAGFVLFAGAVFAALTQVNPLGVRRSGVILFAVAWVLTALVHVVGVEVKGAARWLDLGLFRFQPSELLKPGFVVAAAWMLSEGMRRPGFPGAGAACGLFLACAAVILPQPDVGQTVLLAAVLLTLLLLARVPAVFVASVAGVLATIGAAAALAFPHARERLAAFFGPEAGYQTEKALGAIASGGLLGRGPGEGVVKHDLPDAHADFIYAVAAEEFGVLASLGLLLLFGMAIWRGLARAAALVDPFQQLAAGGLFALLALQTGVHVAVNLDLAPAKGMTLPLVSYGGSSMVGAAVTLGLACALIRDRPGAMLYGSPK